MLAMSTRRNQPRCAHCHRPPIADCDGRGTVVSQLCAYTACANDLDLSRRLWDLKRSKDHVPWHWLDGRGTATTRKETLTVLSVGGDETPWVLVLDADGEVKAVAKSRIASLQMDSEL